MRSSFFNILLVFLLFFSLIACKSKTETIQPKEEKITESVYASGIVKTKDQYQVNSTTNGIIQQLLVKEGDIVKKGDPILVIRNETARLNVENAQLTAAYADIRNNTDKLNEAKANIELGRIKMLNDSSLFVRQQNLWLQQIGTRIELDQRELAYKNSKISYSTARLRYNDLKKQLTLAAEQSRKNVAISSALSKDLTLRSEVSGRVYNLLKEKGEWVTTAMPVAIIGNANDFMLELQVDENDIAKIKGGQKAFVTMDSYKGAVFEASIISIDPIMSEKTKSFTIDAAFTNKPATLYPNLTVEANIVIQTKDKALTIPRNYLMNDSMVMTSDKKTKRVLTGLKDYQKVEILKGLSTADMIIKP